MEPMHCIGLDVSVAYRRCLDPYLYVVLGMSSISLGNTGGEVEIAI